MRTVQGGQVWSFLWQGWAGRTCPQAEGLMHGWSHSAGRAPQGIGGSMMVLPQWQDSSSKEASKQGGHRPLWQRRCIAFISKVSGCPAWEWMAAYPALVSSTLERLFAGDFADMLVGKWVASRRTALDVASVSAAGSCNIAGNVTRHNRTRGARVTRWRALLEWEGLKA